MFTLLQPKLPLCYLFQLFAACQIRRYCRIITENSENIVLTTYVARAGIEITTLVMLSGDSNVALTDCMVDLQDDILAFITVDWTSISTIFSGLYHTLFAMHTTQFFGIINLLQRVSVPVLRR